MSLPASPLAAGLTQVFGALDLSFVAAETPAPSLLSNASLWICDRNAYLTVDSVPDSLRVVVFTADVFEVPANVCHLHPNTPTATLLDLVAAWSPDAMVTLSTREREILALVSRGLSNEEIAQECYVSTATVKTHLLRSFRKLGVSDRASAVYKAVKMGLIV